MIKRIAALILAAVMTLSMSGYVLEEVYAETESTGAEQQEQVVYDVDEDDPEPVAVPEKKEEPATETPETTKEEPAKETVERKQEPAKSDDAEEPVEVPKELSNVRLTGLDKSNDKFTATVSWDEFEGAERYEVTGGNGDLSGTSFTLSGLEAGKDYELTIRAIKTETIDGENEEAVLAESKFTVRTYIKPEVAENKEESSYENGQRVWKNSMKISWDAVPAGDNITYDIRMEGKSLNDSNKVLQEKEFKDLEETYAEFDGLFPSRIYSFTVTAKKGGAEYLPFGEALEAQPKLEKLEYRDLNSGSISPGALTFGNGSTDLRVYAGQSAGGYAVAQGGATDGQYAYILLVSSGNQYGRLAKVSVSNPSNLAAVSDVLPTTHGNGITYDSRRNRIVAIGRDDAGTGRYRRQEITVIDAASLSSTPLMQQNIDYSNYNGDTEYFTSKQKERGLGAISYSPKYDVYIAKQRDYNNLIVIDPDTLKAIGLIMTRVNQHGGSGQAMDGDDQFVYMLKSSYGSNNTNVLFALDWNGNEMIDDETGFRKAFVPGLWACIHGKETAQGSLTPRTPVAMYYINTPYEAENTFHLFDSNGGMHFFMTEYNPNQQYTSAQQAYQAKWKKVKKKVRVRVKKKKRVKKKVNGKWKKVKVTYYKYKWKKKKVWVYKTKYRTVQVPTYKERLDYIYDLGVF